jgi:hypothetical protein
MTYATCGVSLCVMHVRFALTVGLLGPALGCGATSAPPAGPGARLSSPPGVAMAAVPTMTLASASASASATGSTMPRAEQARLPAPSATACAASPAPAVRSWVIDKASAALDFRVTMKGECPGQAHLDGECAGPALLEIFPKGKMAGPPRQRIELGELWVIAGPAGQPLVNSAELYDFQGSLNVGDFNFDGEDDLAIQVGQDGPYGGPTFDIYLYDRAKAQFARSEPLSEISRGTLGLFQIDPIRRRLVTFAKSGCCYHVTEELEVIRDRPVPVSRFIQDATGDGDVIEIRERLVGKRWVRETRKLPRE